MNVWKIEYWSMGANKSPVKKWINNLEYEKFDAIAKELALLEIFGNELVLPHSKALGRGLFELRERQYGYRIYYCFNGKRLILLIAGGNKASQEQDIKIARERLLKIRKE